MFKLSLASATTCLNAILDAANAGSGPAKIYIFGGTEPGTPDTVVSVSTALAALTCADPVGTISARTLTFSAIATQAALDTGTATYFRLTDSDDNIVAQGSVSNSAGSGDLKLSSVAIVTGGDVEITSAAISI